MSPSLTLQVKGSLNGQSEQKEYLQQEKQVSMFEMSHLLNPLKRVFGGFMESYRLAVCISWPSALSSWSLRLCLKSHPIFLHSALYSPSTILFECLNFDGQIYTAVCRALKLNENLCPWHVHYVLLIIQQCNGSYFVQYMHKMMMIHKHPKSKFIAHYSVNVCHRGHSQWLNEGDWRHEDLSLWCCQAEILGSYWPVQETISKSHKSGALIWLNYCTFALCIHNCSLKSSAYIHFFRQ